MNTLEKEIYESLHHNAEMFLRKGIEVMVTAKSNNPQEEKDNISLICALLQTALELACKAYIVSQESLNEILQPKSQCLDEKTLRENLSNNQLKTRTFVEVFSHLSNEKYKNLITKEDRKIIDIIERYRNKTFHFTTFIREEDYNSVKNKAIFLLTHVIVKFLAFDAERPSEYFESILSDGLFRKLIAYEPYVNAMKELAAHDGYEPLCCVNCCQETVNLDDDYCYGCNMDYTDIGRLDCPECGTKNAFIYDTLNIHLQGNHHSMHGCCLKCNTHLPVYECPICHQSRILYENGSIQGQCYEGWCETRKQSYKEDEYVE